MSVLPLILEGPGQNVVQSTEEFELKGGLGGTTIMIQDLDVNQFAGTRESNATYDLRVGAEYRDHRDLGTTALPIHGIVDILSGGALIVETEETVRLPKTVFGHIVPKVSWLQQGVSNTSSKIDPGYNGRLLITIFNLGKRTVTLHRGQPICSVYFLTVAEGATPYDKPGKRIEGDMKRNRLRTLRDQLAMNNAEITALNILFTAILTALLIIRT